MGVPIACFFYVFGFFLRVVGAVLYRVGILIEEHRSPEVSYEVIMLFLLFWCRERRGVLSLVLTMAFIIWLESGGPSNVDVISHTIPGWLRLGAHIILQG